MLGLYALASCSRKFTTSKTAAGFIGIKVDKRGFVTILLVINITWQYSAIILMTGYLELHESTVDISEKEIRRCSVFIY